MAERLVPVREREGNNGQRLRLIGLVMLAAGVVGQAILYNKLLGAATSLADLEKILDNNAGLGIAALLCRLVSTCAVPLFAFLLVEGLKHTSNFGKYFLRVLGLAAVCEIPFDLAMSGKFFNWYSQNPVLGILLCMVMFYFFNYYKGKSFKTVAVAVLVVIMSFLWAGLLRIEEGQPLVLIFTGLWFCRGKKMVQTIVGCVITCLCSTLKVENIVYFAAPMVFLLLHFYNEEPGEGNKIFNYAAYPAMLVACWLIAEFFI